MNSCPSCGASLDNEGICLSCGALSRGYFRNLDLGTPQIANAVAQGLDFYRLLGIAPEADVRSIARRYCQLRAMLFPEDPSGLEPVPARRLELLEVAGRVLTDPRLRRTYDEMRTAAHPETTVTVIRCKGCAAPLQPDLQRCPFCGTQRPVPAAAPVAPAEGSVPPASEPVDYYAMIGLTAQHLLPPLSQSESAPNPLGDSLLGLIFEDQALPTLVPRPENPPTIAQIDMAALDRQRDILLSNGWTQDERDARIEELEIARRILRDDERRQTYDHLLSAFRQGRMGSGLLDTLRYLQDLVRAEMAEERDESVSEAEGTALLQQGLGYLQADLPREAIAPLRHAVRALPKSAEAHSAYARAILASDDPLSLGAHMLRQALNSLHAIDAIAPSRSSHPALAAMCRGLIARSDGATTEAETELRHAVQLDSRLAPAWRALAAIALSRGSPQEALSACRRALAVDPQDERTLLLVVGACLRANQRTQAQEIAAQIAGLRGEEWTAERVLQELGG